MRLSIDQIKATVEVQQRVIPWDLVLVIHGGEYRVKPLGNDDILAFAALGQVRSVDQIKEPLARIIEGRLPELDLDEVQLIYEAVMEAHTAHLKKKSPIKRDAIRIALLAAEAAEKDPAASGPKTST